ncbi:MAG: exodeoxyribonuclease III [Burkholderiales bacterium]
MKLATWNINSLKVRLPQLLIWLEAQQPDVMCLQETKLEDPNFPCDAISAAGYEAYFCGQKAYNGVAVLAKQPGADVVNCIPDFDDPQRRVLAVCFDDVRVVSVYVPNGQTVGSEKYDYKLRWLARFRSWLEQELACYPKLVVLGDYNIAPEDRDVHDPVLWQGSVLTSEPEREKFRELIGLGFVDSFRLFRQEENAFTWWDYRLFAFRRNRGLRIDHILLSPALANDCTSCTIDKSLRGGERPSDHAIVVAELAPGAAQNNISSAIS